MQHSDGWRYLNFAFVCVRALFVVGFNLISLPLPAAVMMAEAYWANGKAVDGTTAIEQIARVYGSQAVVVSLDPRKCVV